MPTAAIYARVSSARQTKEQTIRSQTAALLAHAEQQGLDVPPEWVFQDEGYSGATLVRPALERLRDLVAQVPVEIVLCYAPDRLARRYAYQALLVEELARAGTEVCFLNGPVGDRPEDQLLVQFQGMIAEYEKAQIIERTRRGKAHRAKAGSVNVLSGAPYGYRYVRKSDHAEARYELVEPQATVVRELFGRYTQDGASIADLARWLTGRQIPTRTGKARWDRSTVWGMLRNPAYAGRAAFAKTQRTDQQPRLTRRARLAGQTISRNPVTCDRPHEQWVQIAVPAIVSDETFQLAARRLADNRRFAACNTKVPSLLQGLAACASCGYAYYRTSARTSTRRLYYYRCLGSDDYRYPGGRRCANLPVRADYLDQVIWDHVTGLLAYPTLIRAELDRRLAELHAANPARATKARLQREATRTTTAISRLVEAYQEQLLSLEELRARTPALRAKEQTLRAQLDALDAQLVDQETYLKLAETLESFLGRLRDKADTASVTERQRVLRLIVREVLIGPERVVVRHRIPVTSPDPAPGYLLRGRSLGDPLGRLPAAAARQDRGGGQQQRRQAGAAVAGHCCLQAGSGPGRWYLRARAKGRARSARPAGTAGVATASKGKKSERPARFGWCVMGRRVGAWLLAAVVTAALVVGGVVLAGGRERAPAVLPPLELGDAQASAAGAEPATEPAGAGAATPARPYDTGDVPNLRAPGTYRVRGTLPDLPDRARAWKLGSDPGGGRIAALTGALGLGGQPKQDQAGWTLTDRDRSLRVNRLAGLPWNYGNLMAGACAGPWSPGSPAAGRGVQCLAPDTPTAKQPGAVKPGAGGSGAGSAGSPGSGAVSSPSPGTLRPVVPGRLIRPVPRPADLPSREAAERVARDFATKAGLPFDGASVKVADGYAARVVTIAPAVGGLPTHGFSWTVAVGPKGRIQYASGWLATPQPADTYPLIGVAEGLERLRRQPAIWPPVLRPNTGEGATVQKAPCPPDTRRPCIDRPPSKRVMTVTGVRLGLQLAPGVPKADRPAGAAFLLPAYLFGVEGGWTEVRSVVAVQDRYRSP